MKMKYATLMMIYFALQDDKKTVVITLTNVPLAGR